VLNPFLFKVEEREIANNKMGNATGRVYLSNQPNGYYENKTLAELLIM
jgi:hypothetical protein